MANVTLQIDGNSSGAQAAIASLERRLEAAEAKLQRVKSTAEKPLKTDPFAARMSQGSTSGAFIAEKMSTQHEEKRIAAAIKLAQIRKSELAAVERSAAAEERKARAIDQQVAHYQRQQQLGQKGGLFGGGPGAPIGKLFGAVGAAALADAVAVGNRNKAWSEDISKSSYSMGELELKLMNQADLTKKEAQDRIRLTGTILKGTPSIGTLAGGVEMQTWLESAGLNKADVSSGKMLNVIAKGLTTLNAFGKDKGFTSDKESVRTIVGGAKAFGLGDTAEAVEHFSNVVSMGFKVSAMEAYQLPSFLKEAAGLSAFKVTPEQSMGLFSTMVSQGMPAESAVTGMRNYATRLANIRGAGESDEDLEERISRRTEILESLNLKQADLQITGENDIFKSLAKLRTALADKTEGEQQTAIAGLFGSENFAAVSMMLRDQDVMKGKVGEISDFSSLAKTVEQSRGHAAFARTRAGLEKEINDWESSVKIGTTWEDVEQWKEKRYSKRMSEATTPAERSAASQENVLFGVGNWFAKMFGYTPEEVGGLGARREAEAKRDELLERTARAAEATAQNTINARLRNGNVEPVAAGGLAP